ncbi:threonine ammonia-lyase [Sphingomonas jejuensis]|uniref:threonine ammonia-lyase n=1 Tax=Sphingomonas jejuensis TaxID=904715 RepID=UPI001FD7C2D0|nr:pyridoxal-phosphate dependent enzyme [Sphingomonas jejuensis]
MEKVVVPTPLLPLDIGGPAPLWCKAESLQPVGAFKLRGAWHRLTDLSDDERARGVVAFSSGNHAQGVAWAARRLGIDATIVMPTDAPAAKRAATLALGAEIVGYDRATESREAIAAAFAAARGATLVPSFDDAWIIEGQGTAGLEAATQMDAWAGGPPDRAIICCGGGGLAAGIALALPETEIVVVEPEGWDDMARSLAAGEILAVGPNPPPTACDALQTTRVSPLTFGVLHARGARGVAVSEEEVRAAQRLAFSALNLVVEPGGAVALAAVLAGRVAATARTLVTLSGGNVDPAAFARVIAR